MNDLELFTAEPHSFSLFAALRTIERNDPKGRLLGNSRRLRDDPVRITQPPYLSFAPTEVAGFEPGGSVQRLNQYVFGFLGPNGPLPLHITELAYTRLQHFDDTNIADFLNAMQHRIASLFYRAWADADPTTSSESANQDTFAAQVRSLFGQSGAESIGPGLAPPRCAGLLAIQTRSPAALQALLNHTFGLPFSIIEFTGEWLKIPEQNWLRLGSMSEDNALGRSATLGRESWQRSGAIELIAGPLTLADLARFLPGKPELAALRSLIASFAHRHWTWRLRLVLRPGDAHPTQLGGEQRLGLTTWLGTRLGMADEVVINGDPITN